MTNRALSSVMILLNKAWKRTELSWILLLYVCVCVCVCVCAVPTAVLGVRLREKADSLALSSVPSTWQPGRATWHAPPYAHKRAKQWQRVRQRERERERERENSEKESSASLSIAIEELATVVTDHHSQHGNHLNRLCQETLSITENNRKYYDGLRS